ncbi:hypothetical protein Leryth_027112 [Lithospermum erythrorhizon]|nr:hypothetical protein Leryth_027112 [Lithospermum erythrorhizon]
MSTRVSVPQLKVQRGHGLQYPASQGKQVLMILLSKESASLNVQCFPNDEVDMPVAADTTHPTMFNEGIYL